MARSRCAREKRQRQQQRTADAKELRPAAPAPIRPPTSLRSFFSRPPSAPPPASGAPQPPSPAPTVTTADRIADPPDPPADPATTPPSLLPADLPDDVVAASAATSPSAIAAATSPEPGESCSICLELIHLVPLATGRASLTPQCMSRWGESTGESTGVGASWRVESPGEGATLTTLTTLTTLRRVPGRGSSLADSRHPGPPLNTLGLLKRQ